MVSEGSLLIQSSIATTFCNFKSDSRDGVSTMNRTEGWTEVWGDERKVVDASEECWMLENAEVSRMSENDTLPGGPSLTLQQYRPAWLEQLVLRIAGVPHIVLNSPFSSNESTGPLPVLRDCQPKSNLPVLVGRRQPKIRAKLDDEDDKATTATSIYEAPAENNILGYLKKELGIDLDAHWKQQHDEATAKKLQTQSTLLSHLITTKLRNSLMILRYEDLDAWEQVYRKQCLECSRKSSSDPSGKTTTTNRLPTIRGLFQAWSERVLARKLLRSSDTPSVERAKLEARNDYQLLEQQLQDHNNYLLGTSQPALVDAILWDHLAEALCDVNLVVILADFPILVKYFQRINDLYFTATASDDKESLDWNAWNRCQNQINAFQQIPLEADIKQKEDLKQFKHALELMQTLSVREHDLLEVLKVGKAARERGNATSVKATTASAPSSEPPKELTAVEVARREHERSDQYWISLVVGAAILVGLSMAQTGEA